MTGKGPMCAGRGEEPGGGYLPEPLRCSRCGCPSPAHYLQSLSPSTAVSPRRRPGPVMPRHGEHVLAPGLSAYSGVRPGPPSSAQDPEPRLQRAPRKLAQGRGRPPGGGALTQFCACLGYMPRAGWSPGRAASSEGAWRLGIWERQAQVGQAWVSGTGLGKAACS